MIECNGLTKKYFIGTPGEVTAVKNVSFKIKKGDFITITGPSGSGKSTLLHLLSALDRPTSGEVLINGESTLVKTDKELSLLRRKMIGFIFQGFNLLPIISAIENVILPLVPAGLSKSFMKNKAVSVLSAVGLSHRLYHKPTELSGGERQRVAIARALVNDPLIVFADEPTGELDSSTGLEIIRLMKKLNREKGTTFVIVTHDESITKYAKTHLKMRDGVIESLHSNKNHDSHGL